ncbi:MAG: hypothetical protein IBJ03_02625 [Gemmatimonadaceae bacterium]|nr:hypothetical protein [Gemmatimonadaceae bacterium]
MSLYDPSNPVVALCAEGMQHEGEPPKARACFERAWAARVNDFDASIAAHYLARHQATPAETLRWNAIAMHHAEQLPAEQAVQLLPSLCLNLGDSYASVGRLAEAEIMIERALEALSALPPDGYGEFVRGGVERLRDRVAAARGSTLMV